MIKSQLGIELNLEALKKDREGLARAAIARKLEIELNELAEMTDNTVRNQQEL